MKGLGNNIDELKREVLSQTRDIESERKRLFES